MNPLVRNGGCYWAPKHSCQGCLTYLAAARPSSIRHRHTSRGCLWRTLHRETGKNNSEEAEQRLMKGEILPEINFVHQMETGSAGWSPCRQHVISVGSLSWEERQEFLGEQLGPSGHQIHISLSLQPHIEESYFSITVVSEIRYYTMAAAGKEDERGEEK